MEPNISKTCAVIKEFEISIEAAPWGQPQLLSSQSPSFEKKCHKIFSAVLMAEKMDNMPPSIWQPWQIKTVQEFAKKHGFKTVINARVGGGSYFDSLSILAATRTIYAGVAMQTHNITEEALKFKLDHEFGHIRDMNIFESLQPDALPLLLSENLTWEEFVEMTNAHLKVLREGVPTDQRARFDQYVQHLFGDLSARDFNELGIIVRYLGEAIRWGEEIMDPRIFGGNKNTGLLRGTPPTRNRWKLTNSNGVLFPMGDIAFIAMLQEAGLWEKYQALPDFNKDVLKEINPEYVDFFRLCIRAGNKLQKQQRLNEKR